MVEPDRELNTFAFYTWYTRKGNGVIINTTLVLLWWEEQAAFDTTSGLYFLWLY